jgi:GT2 family glycosyltransferase
VDDSGNYQIIDQEWRLHDPVEAEFILFRGLLWFGFSNQHFLQPFFKRNNLHNLKKFIEYCYHRLSLHIDYLSQVDHFIAFEERLQAETAIQYRSDPVKKSINRPFEEDPLDSWPKTFNPQLYWADYSSEFTESSCISYITTIQTDPQRINFRLPNNERKIEKLRFDPDTQPGFFHIYTIRLFCLHKRTGERELIWGLEGNRSIGQNSQLIGIHYCKSALGDALCATTHDPQLIFKLPDLSAYARDKSIFQLEVEMDCSKSADFLIAKDTFINAYQSLNEDLKDKNKFISILQAKITDSEKLFKDKLTNSEKFVEEQKHRLSIAESELELIKNSKVWRAAEILRRLFYIKFLNNLPQLKRIGFALRQYGFRQSAAKGIKYLRIVLSGNRPMTGEGAYQRWLAKNYLTKNDIKKLALDLKKFRYTPLISIIMPVFNVDERWLKKAIDSVLAQVYPNWELCIVDDGSHGEYIKAVIDEYRSKDRRIKVKYLHRNRGISEASNEALSMATGQFVGLLDHDDELSQDALFEVVRALNDNGDLNLIYSDEDKLSMDGVRSEPFFKPDWSPDTFCSYNYICHFTVIRKEIIDEVGGFRKGFEGSQDYDLFLRVTDKTQKIFHIPKILYHWRTIDTSVAKDPDSKLYAFENGKKAITEHLERNKLHGKVENASFLGNYRIRYYLEEKPKVTILIPSKDKVDVLKRCIDSITEKSSYAAYEIVIIDNGSSKQATNSYYQTLRSNDQIRVLKYDHPFNFSAINNYGVANTDSEYIIFLNNDTEVITEDWIEAMLEFAQRDDVGAVGALLYYPNDTVQHAGVIVGIGGVAGHAHKHSPRDAMGYYSRIKINQNLSAVTAACLMTKKSVFESVGGFDENFSHAFNDIDLCLKIRQNGYLIVYTPYSELYHHESLSRGYEDTPSKINRFADEIIYFKKRWHRELEQGDPYYNPNLTLNREDFTINI